MDSENKKCGYGMVYQSVMRDRNLSVKAKAVYAYLSCCAGSKNECYPSRRLILNDLCICGDTLDVCIKQLINYGYVEKSQVKEKGKFSKNLYKINHIPVTEKPVTEKPVTEIPVTEKPDTNNNNNNIKKLYSSDEEYNQKGKPFCRCVKTVKNEFGDAEPAQSNTLTESISAKRRRYNAEQLKVIDSFFDVLKYTRRGGRIADGVKLRIYDKWEKYETQKVIYGLSVYIDNPALHDKKENYALGIIRNLAAGEISGKSGKTKAYDKLNKFINYEQRDWDFNTLDKLKSELLDRGDSDKKRMAEDIEDDDALKRVMSKSGTRE